MRVLIFGDSIAYGEYDSRGGWANRLYLDYLNEQAKDLEGDHPFIFNLSIGGDLTRGVINRLPHETEARRWHGEEFVFVFAVGINDSKRLEDGRPISSPEQYAKDLTELLVIAQKYTSKILFVGLTSVEDEKFEWHKYEVARVWEFEQVLRDFVQERNIPFVPLFEFFEKRGRLLIDGLHPNDEGHDIIYKQIQPALEKLLS